MKLFPISASQSFPLPALNHLVFTRPYLFFPLKDKSILVKVPAAFHLSSLIFYHNIPIFILAVSYSGYRQSPLLSQTNISFTILDSSSFNSLKEFTASYLLCYDTQYFLVQNGLLFLLLGNNFPGVSYVSVCLEQSCDCLCSGLLAQGRL